MNRRFLFSLILCGLIFVNGRTQQIATFEVELNNAGSGLEVPVKTSLNAITLPSDTALSLVELQGNKRTVIPFQIENGEQRTLYWLIKPGNRSGKHVFELIKGKSENGQNSVHVKAEDGLMTIYVGDRKLLGLLLRKDLHALFDDYLIAIHPDTLKVYFAPKVASDSDYQSLNKKVTLQAPRVYYSSCSPSKTLLEYRWHIFNKEHGDVNFDSA